MHTAVLTPRGSFHYLHLVEDNTPHARLVIENSAVDPTALAGHTLNRHGWTLSGPFVKQPDSTHTAPIHRITTGE